jgi:tetratricopeptide (TPR) repeat protein
MVKSDFVVFSSHFQNFSNVSDGTFKLQFKIMRLMRSKESTHVARRSANLRVSSSACRLSTSTKDEFSLLTPNPVRTEDSQEQVHQQPEPNANNGQAPKQQENVVSDFLAETGDTSNSNNATSKVDRDLTRMVEDRMYGYRRTQTGDFRYETSLLGDGAVRFREGVRLGNPLPVNADRLTYLAKKELQHGRVDEAREYYAYALDIDPRDGRGYLGLSRCAERRRDFALAREHLKIGIANAVSVGNDAARTPDRGANPFLLQALGCLEEKMGRLAEAEALYIAAAKSRPSHAAAWLSLAQLRTKKLGQSANTGRVCFQTAEREIKRAGVRQSSHIYTAWASLEYNKGGDTRRARELFNMALEIDPKCSAAWLQLGVMERRCENWEEAQACFDAVLTFDQRNSRVLQAYAIMETKRPDGSSRQAIELFERALKANPRDAGVLQPYALYVAELRSFRLGASLVLARNALQPV